MMIKHIVMWRLKTHAEGATKAENALKIKEFLESLPKTIPVICSLEVGLNAKDSDAAADIVLVTTFASWDDLDYYQRDTDHLRVADFVKRVVDERWVVDYES